MNAINIRMVVATPVSRKIVPMALLNLTFVSTCMDKKNARDIPINIRCGYGVGKPNRRYP